VSRKLRERAIANPITREMIVVACERRGEKLPDFTPLTIMKKYRPPIKRRKDATPVETVPGVQQAERTRKPQQVLSRDAEKARGG